MPEQSTQAQNGKAIATALGIVLMVWWWAWPDSFDAMMNFILTRNR